MSELMSSKNLYFRMPQIRNYKGISDNYWDSYADFATHMNGRFSRLELRDEIRMAIFPSYLEGEALVYFKQLNSAFHFTTYDQMFNTLQAEFTKLELQAKASENKKKLDSLLWDKQQMNVRDFADVLQSHVSAAFPLVGKTAQEELKIYYLREKTHLQLGLPMWLNYDELVRAMVKIYKN